MIQIRCDLHAEIFALSEVHIISNNGVFSIACVLRMLLKHWSNARYLKKYVAVSLTPQTLQYIKFVAVIKSNFYYVSLTVVIQCYRKIFTFEMRCC